MTRRDVVAYFECRSSTSQLGNRSSPYRRTIGIIDADADGEEPT
jgi:hypothetical protein